MTSLHFSREYNGYRLGPLGDGNFGFISDKDVRARPVVFTREERDALHHLTGGDCDDESCKCRKDGFERGISARDVERMSTHYKAEVTK